MSTQYEVYEDSQGLVEVSEMSCKLSIGVTDPTGESHWTGDMTVDQYKEMLVKMIKAGSYIADDSMEFLEFFNQTY